MNPPPVIAAMFDMLPPPGPWPQAARRRWMLALATLVDFVYDTDPPLAPDDDTPAEWPKATTVWPSPEPDHEPEPSVDPALVCDECGFVARGKQGMAGHRAMHRREREAQINILAPEPADVTAPTDDREVRANPLAVAPARPTVAGPITRTPVNVQAARDAAAQAAYVEGLA